LEKKMGRQGSAGNVIAALCSFMVPGLGQLIQGRPFTALFYFVIDVILWIFLLGWLMHIFACLDAAWYKA
jgi:TM2 domain-containing membrane protein YozV